METPRLLAIDDVHLAAMPELATSVAEFYTNIIGLQMVEPRPEAAQLIFRGYSIVKPRLVVTLTPDPGPEIRGMVQIQVASLLELEQVVVERGLESYTVQALSHFDRRLTILDPAGNRVTVLAYHPL